MIDYTPRLTTIAVGGPAAGQSLSGEYGTAKYICPEPIHVSAAFPMEPQRISMRYEIYHEMKLAWSDSERGRHDFKFWAHADTIKDEPSLLRELANGYRPVNLNIVEQP